MSNKSASFIGKLIFIIIYQSIFITLTFFFLKRVGAFGCFDDCFNYGAGNFLLQGKQLYSQIFFNHQPFMAYISAVVQYISHPQTLFELVKYHRIVALLFANLCGTFLVLRFGFPLFIALLMFETTKFYIFGDRFLAEGLIVYPMIYLILLVWNKSIGKAIYKWEYIIAAICSWFIFWMREPFIPWSGISLILFYLLGKKDSSHKLYIRLSIILFITLHILTVISMPFNEYIFNVVTTNMRHEVTVQPWTLLTMVQIVFYPIFVLIHGYGNIFQNVLLHISIIFCLAAGYQFFYLKRIKEIVIMIVLLALANLRVVPVGTMYYDAFHMIPWYGITLVITLMFIFEFREHKQTKVFSYLVYVFLAITTVYGFLSPQAFSREQIDTQVEFTNNYANYFSKGQIIKYLAKPGDTMFVEMWEDPIYFVAGVPTAYSYSWYTSIMPFFTTYQIARDDMFKNTPPTFYVGACRSEEYDSFALSKEYKEKYTQLLNSSKPSCVYIRNDAITSIGKNKLEQILEYGYTLP